MTIDSSGTDSVLAHYGKKGMKWGVRNDTSSSAGSSSSGKPKPKTVDILNARERVNEKSRAIDAQTARVNKSTGESYLKESQKLREMKTDLLLDPDRATAARMTAGQKGATAAVLLFVPGVGTLAALGYAGTKVVKRRTIEKEQR